MFNENRFGEIPTNLYQPISFLPKRSRLISQVAHRVFWVLALSAVFPLAGRASDDGDNAELWNELKVTAKWTPDIDLFAAGTLRFEDNFSVLNRTSAQFGFNLRPMPWLTFSPNYQYIVHDPAEDARTHEHRPAVGTAVRVPIHRAEITISTGLEFRFREDKEASWRVRPKIKLKHPLGPDEWKLSGYLADEIFYDETANDFVRDRFFAGFEKKLGRNWGVELYYCHQFDLQNREPDLDIVGVSVGFRFDLTPAAKATTPLMGK